MMNFQICLSLLVVACVGYAVTEVTDPPKPIVTSTETTNSSTAGTTLPPTTTDGTSAKTSHATTVHTTSHTVAPTTPKPTTDLWGATYHNGSYCILLKATISIDFKYKSKTSNQTATSRISLTHSNTTSSDGHCGSDSQWIRIGFYSDWNLTLVYEKSSDGKYYYQSEAQLVWNNKDAHISGAPTDMSGNDRNLEPMFNTSKAGYLCMARTTLYNNASVENGLLAIYTEQLKFEAFQVRPEPKFSDNEFERCKEDTISNLVPIIVGACLGGLIIIVLIAYLIGRKRSRRGYESV